MEDVDKLIRECNGRYYVGGSFFIQEGYPSREAAREALRENAQLWQRVMRALEKRTIKKPRT